MSDSISLDKLHNYCDIKITTEHTPITLVGRATETFEHRIIEVSFLGQFVKRTYSIGTPIERMLLDVVPALAKLININLGYIAFDDRNQPESV